MSDGGKLTPAVQLLDVHASNLLYPPVDNLAHDPLENDVEMSFAPADPLEPPSRDPGGEHGTWQRLYTPSGQNTRKGTAIICICCLAMAIGERPCPHPINRDFYNGMDSTGGSSSSGGGSAGPMSVAPAVPSGLAAAYHAPEVGHVQDASSWKYSPRLDPLVDPSASRGHYASSPAPSADSVFSGGLSRSSTIKGPSSSAEAKVDDCNVKVERSTTSSQPVAGAPGAPHVSRLPPRFQRYQTSYPTPPQYLVAVGRHVGVFASEPSYVNGPLGFSHFLGDNYEEDVK
ncbi:hypothetical protein GSI_04102 [Ganoderma sinense ZZ0214-1]|uniref:Uncharacterized protein n=1 Tax=Ganoderma sinense ZZ0214-1 TaxID=1077348 RepID=A0A2G8SI82_9APHY|nr:hypothetical protein GSI_04102 [Ganoderma sinense ZZ0214-1]